MTVTPFLPTATSTAPSTAPSTATSTATSAGTSAEAAGRTASPEDRPASGTAAADGFVDALTAALAAALTLSPQPAAGPADGPSAPAPSEPADSLSALVAATPRGLPGSGGPALTAALPGDPTTPGAGPGLPVAASTDVSAAQGPTAGPAAGPGPLEVGGGVIRNPPTAPSATGRLGDQPPATPPGAPPTSPVRRNADAASAPDAAAGTVPAPDLLGPTPTLPPTGTAPALSVTGSHGPGPTPERAAAVVRQVFPEVSRVAGHAGPGTHRLAITLHPETLGEVRVMLVVRPGAVHVRLSADSAEAQRALAQGAPELHRLLAVAGGDASVVVREAAPGATGASAGADPRGSDGRGGEPSYPSWAAGGRGEAGGSREHRGHAGQRPPERGEPLVPSVPVRRPGPASSTVRPGRLDRLM